MATLGSADDLDPTRLVAEALADGARLLPDAILPLVDTFCGCGNPEIAWQWVIDYLVACDTEQRWPHNTGADLIAIYLLDHLRLTEHGVSVNGAWLTDAGREVLAFLREHGPTWEEESKWVGSDGVWRSML